MRISRIFSLHNMCIQTIDKDTKINKILLELKLRKLMVSKIRLSRELTQMIAKYQYKQLLIQKFS